MTTFDDLPSTNENCGHDIEDGLLCVRMPNHKVGRHSADLHTAGDLDEQEVFDLLNQKESEYFVPDLSDSFAEALKQQPVVSEPPTWIGLTESSMLRLDAIVGFVRVKPGTTKVLLVGDHDVTLDLDLDNVLEKLQQAYDPPQTTDNNNE